MKRVSLLWEHVSFIKYKTIKFISTLYFYKLRFIYKIGESVMVKIYKVIAEGTAEKIEERINQVASEGWELVEFGFGAMQSKFWALLVKKE